MPRRRRDARLGHGPSTLNSQPQTLNHGPLPAMPSPVSPRQCDIGYCSMGNVTVYHN